MQCLENMSGRSTEESVEALNFILEAWEQGTEIGIAPDLMAYAAIDAALTDRVTTFGEQSVEKLVDGLAPRVRAGEFTLYRSRQ